MSKRKTQTAIDDYIAEGFIREALVNYLALLGWSTGTEEEILSLDELAAAVRRRPHPEGRRGLRPGAPRVAQRPVDPPAVAGRPRRPVAAVPRRRAPTPAISTGCHPTTRSRALIPLVQERLPTLGAIGDLVGFLFVDRPVARPRDPRPEALGRRDDPGRARRRRARRSRRTASSRSTTRGSSSPLRGSPRRAAGRRATCSWPSGSRSRAGRRRRRCSRRSWRSGFERTLERAQPTTTSCRRWEPPR